MTVDFGPLVHLSSVGGEQVKLNAPVKTDAGTKRPVEGVLVHVVQPSRWNATCVREARCRR
jgi:hypothetical protein